MRTTLDIDDDLLEEARHSTGATTKTALVEMGLKALVEAAARRRLVAVLGTVPGAMAPPRGRTRGRRGR